MDDPMIVPAVIDFESTRDNSNCVLVTSKFGGHMGYYENAFSESQWWAKPVLDYLYILSI
jgi:predicted alpha/beta-fold hydrolase